MKLTTEYLVIIEKKTSEALFRLCDSVDAFNKFLQTENGIKIENNQIKYKDDHTFGYEVTSGTVEGKEQRYFHIKLQSLEESVDLEQFTDLNRVIKGLVHTAGGQPETLWNDVSLFYSEHAYPYIHRIENLMRKLITYFMLTNVGKEWVAEASPSTVREVIDKSKRQQYLDVLFQTDFKHLGDFLFKEYQTKNISELYDKLDEVNRLDEFTLEELRSFKARSNWDRYFSDIVDCEGAYLDKRWKQLYDLRCMIAHNTIVGRHEYERIIHLVDDVEEYLQRAFDNLDKIHVPDEDKDQVAENVASNLSASYGNFIQLWKSFESILSKIASDLDHETQSEPSSVKQAFEIIYDNEIIDEDSFAEGERLIEFRNILVHGASVSIGEDEIRNYASRLESLIDTLKTTIKPASFHKECISRIEKHLGQSFTNRSRTLYISLDENTALTCAVSKAYERGDYTYYWFAFHRSQKQFLEQANKGYAAFGCGSEETIIVLPYNEFSEYLNYMSVTDRNNRYYWHVRIMRDDNNFFLQRSGEEAVDLSQFLLSDEE